MGKFTDYLGKAGNFVLDAARESVYRQNEEFIDERDEQAISITTAALYEAKVKDDVIIRMLQKYWGLTESESREKLRIEKTVEYPCTAVAEYLMTNEAMTREEADNIIIYDGVLDYLKTEKTAWKLSPKELLEKAGIKL